MSRVVGVALGLVLVFLCFFVSMIARASVLEYDSDEAAAYSACMAFGAQYGYVCKLYTGSASVSGGGTCASGKNMQPGYGAFNGSSFISGTWAWCVPSSCVSGSNGGDFGGLSAPTAKTDRNGCCVTWSGVGSITYGGSTWQSYDAARTGSYCFEGYSASNTPPGSVSTGSPPNKMCDPGQVSCYNPADNTACYTTQSGEQVCAKLDQADNCVSGATGSVCYSKDGTPPPTPNDPPIAKGQPPDNTQTGTSTGTQGSTSFTQNNYSGTSPGPGPSSSSTDQTTGTSASNQNGSGNSPGPSGDHGTDSNGKCPDGSVPTASGCSGTATDNGCDTPPACYGDAVMCASFREEVAIRCNTANAASGSSSGSSNIGDPASALAGAGVPADGGASGDPSTSGLVSSSDLGEDGFDASGLGFSRTCPANPAFDVLGHSYTLDLTPMCNFASLLGWFVLLVASLVGLRIVATGKA